MKKVQILSSVQILSLASWISMLLLPLVSAQAGPFVSGGMPEIIECSDASQVYWLKIYGQVGTSLAEGTYSDRTSSGTPSADLNCRLVNQFDPRTRSTVLYYVCGAAHQPGLVNIYRDTTTGNRSAIFFKKNSHGAQIPVSLSCHR